MVSEKPKLDLVRDGSDAGSIESWCVMHKTGQVLKRRRDPKLLVGPAVFFYVITIMTLHPKALMLGHADEHMACWHAMIVQNAHHQSECSDFERTKTRFSRLVCCSNAQASSGNHQVKKSAGGRAAISC